MLQKGWGGGGAQATVLSQVSMEFCGVAENKCSWMESSTYISVKTAREPKHGAARALSSSEGWETKALLQRQKKPCFHVMTARGVEGGDGGRGGGSNAYASV